MRDFQAVYLYFQGKKYLLDAGKSNSFMENAKSMEVNLMDVETCILSHGHYDHSGGFGSYLNENKKVKVFAMKSAPDDYYTMVGGLRYIGIPKEIMERHYERFEFIEDITKLDEHVYLIPHNTGSLGRIGERAKLM